MVSTPVGLSPEYVVQTKQEYHHGLQFIPNPEWQRAAGLGDGFLFIQQILTTCYEPGSDLCTGDIVMNKIK